MRIYNIKENYLSTETGVAPDTSQLFTSDLTTPLHILSAYKDVRYDALNGKKLETVYYREDGLALGKIVLTDKLTEDGDYLDEIQKEVYIAYRDFTIDSDSRFELVDTKIELMWSTRHGVVPSKFIRDTPEGDRDRTKGLVELKKRASNILNSLEAAAVALDVKFGTDKALQFLIVGIRHRFNYALNVVWRNTRDTSVFYSQVEAMLGNPGDDPEALQLVGGLTQLTERCLISRAILANPATEQGTLQYQRAEYYRDETVWDYIKSYITDSLVNVEVL